MVIEQPVGKQHLSVDECGIVAADEATEGQIALVDHRCCDVGLVVTEDRRHVCDCWMLLVEM